MSLVVVVVVIPSTPSEQCQQIVHAEFHVLDLVTAQRRLGEFPFSILKLVRGWGKKLGTSVKCCGSHPSEGKWRARRNQRW